MRYGYAVFAGAMMLASPFGAAYAASSSETVPTAVATTTAVSQTSTQNVVRTISNAISGSLARVFNSGGMFKSGPSNKRTSMADGETGISAGEGGATIGTWGSLDYTYLRVVPDGNSDQRRLTDIYTGVAGADYAFDDHLLGGVAVSYARANTDGRKTKTNGAKLNQESDSITVSPYLGYSPLENLTIDSMIGYTHSFIRTHDYSSSTVATGSNDSDTYFAAVNAGYVFGLTDHLAFKVFAGFSAQHAEVDSYRDSQNNDIQGDTSEHWQARVGGKLMTALADTSQGYLSAAYERDKSMVAISESSLRLSAGTATDISSALNFNLEATANVGRETQQEYGLAANLRLAF